jgi:hypothetical protein
MTMAHIGTGRVAADAAQTQRDPATRRVAPGWRSLETVEASREALHRRPFLVRHPLADHPLFRPEQLVSLAQEAARRPGDLYLDAGNVGLDDKWGEIPVPDMPVADVIRRIATAEAWIIMKHVEKHPAYGAVLDEFARFVLDLAGPEKAVHLLSPEMLVLITSPNRLTPFHFDAEPNFLVQIVGEKDVWICDPADDTIITEEEKERYYAGDRAAARFKPHAPAQAWRFRLKPGDAVHIPTHGAHWVQNRNNLSVSLSLNFEFPGWMYRDVYRANHLMRRMGLSPAPAGGRNDRVKAATFRTLASARNAARRVTGAKSAG